MAELRGKDELQSAAEFGGSGGKDSGLVVTISHVAHPKELTRDTWQGRQCIPLCRIIEVEHSTQTCPF